MITPLLEKAIMKGKATYSKYTHAMGMFSSLPIADGTTVIITEIKWNQFLNPYKNDGSITINDFFKYNEYQLKIDGKKSTNYLHYRNHWVLQAISASVGLGRADLISDWMNQAHGGPFLFQPAPPILQDVFFVCTEFLNITVSRNCFIDTLTSNYGLLSNSAAQNKMPNGVQDEPVLKSLQMQSNTPSTMYYVPPGLSNAGISSPGARTVTNYSQDIDPLSQIYPPETGFNAQINSPYSTQPLVEFGIVTINSMYWDTLANS